MDISNTIINSSSQGLARGGVEPSENTDGPRICHGEGFQWTAKQPPETGLVHAKDVREDNQQAVWKRYSLPGAQWKTPGVWNQTRKKKSSPKGLS